MPTKKELVVTDRIANAIHLVRGQKVMLDFDLAALYAVSTKALNQAVGRNRDRFPDDFVFQLTRAETQNLRSQFVTSSRKHRGATCRVYALTEQGVAMLSGVLRNERAVRKSR